METAVNKIALSVFILLCSVWYSVVAQHTPLLEVKVSIHATQKPIAEVLQQIESQAHFTFAYAAGVFTESEKVTLTKSNITVREALDAVFQNNVLYRERKGHIILSRLQNKETQTWSRVHGYIIDAMSGEKIPETSIYEKKSRLSATSDKYGHYMLAIKGEEQYLTLFVNKKNYKDTVIYIKQKGHTLYNITLYPEINATMAMPITADKERNNTDTINEIDNMALVQLLLNEMESTHVKNISDTLHRKLQVSLLPFIGTNHSLSGVTVNEFSFNLIAGYNMGTSKVELGGFLNIDRGDVKSWQLAGFGNLNGGNTKGLQAAGFFNFNNGTTQGINAAGFFNFFNHYHQGLQLAGFANIDADSCNGFAAAGFTNIICRKSDGLLMAGFANVAIKDITGFALSGFSNVALKNSKGVSVAGFSNICVDTLRGVQIAGVINYAKCVKGVQLGLFNFSDTCSGVPIGLFNFSRKGYHKLEISADEVFYLNVAFRTGVKRFHNIVTAGVDPRNFVRPLHYYGYGIGTTQRLGRRLDLDFDITMNQIAKAGALEHFNTLNKVALTLDISLNKYFSIAAGPVANVLLLNIDDRNFTYFNNNVAPYSNYTTTVINNNYQLQGWIGGKIALRFF